MRNATLAAVIATAALTLTGCGGNTPDATPAGPPIDGCTETTTEEIYVAKLYDCTARGTSVYLFNTTSARDSYWQIAAEFGGTKIAEGDTWIETETAS